MLEQLAAEYHELCDNYDRAYNTGPMGSRGVPLPANLDQFQSSCQYAKQCFLRVAEKAAIHGFKREAFRAALKGDD